MSEVLVAMLRVVQVEQLLADRGAAGWQGWMVRN